MERGSARVDRHRVLDAAPRGKFALERLHDRALSELAAGQDLEHSVAFLVSDLG
jgi:hypothetical protein